MRLCTCACVGVCVLSEVDVAIIILCVRCEHARFCVEVFLCAMYKFSFIHSFIVIVVLRLLF